MERHARCGDRRRQPLGLLRQGERLLDEQRDAERQQPADVAGVPAGLGQHDHAVRPHRRIRRVADLDAGCLGDRAGTGRVVIPHAGEGHVRRLPDRLEDVPEMGMGRAAEGKSARP